MKTTCGNCESLSCSRKVKLLAQSASTSVAINTPAVEGEIVFFVEELVIRRAMVQTFPPKVKRTNCGWYSHSEIVSFRGVMQQESFRAFGIISSA